MYDALSCVVNPSTDPTDYEDLFGYICQHDKNACLGFQHIASSGTYGAYSMCNSTQQLGWAFNVYYFSQNKASDACSFKGAAMLQNPSSGGSDCKNLLAQAGNAGTGTVTSQPTGTGSSNSGGSGSGSSASSSKAAASAINVPRAGGGLLPIALVVALSLVSGFAMVLL